MSALGMETGATGAGGRKVARVIGWREVIKPAGVAFIPFCVLVNAAISQSNGPGYPIIYSILLISIVTFAYRAGWLALRCKTHVLVANAKTFAPERFAYLGLVIASVMVVIAFMTGQTVVSSSSNMTQWVAGLLTTVPLLEVFGGNWGQLQAQLVPNDEVEQGAEPDLRANGTSAQLSGGQGDGGMPSNRIETWMA